MTDGKNLFDLSGHTALVTGGGYGLGRGLVHGLAAHGATVIGLARSERALADTFCDARGRRTATSSATSPPTRCTSELDEIAEPIDILVNNAGGDPHTKPWGQQTTQEWRDTYEINVIAAERLCKPAHPEDGAAWVGARHQHLVRSTVRSVRTPTTPGGTPAPAPTPRPSTASSD